MSETYFDQSDIEQNKTIVLLSAVLQIFVPILFLLPLVACQNSPYGRFYANQGLLLMLLYIVLWLVNIVPFLGQIVCAIGALAVFVCEIINIINASKGVRKGIPILGEIEIIK